MGQESEWLTQDFTILFPECRCTGIGFKIPFSIWYDFVMNILGLGKIL
jgi:hypothetical protein